jgi:hypothetical protein
MNKIDFFFSACLLTLLCSCATVSTQKETIYYPNDIVRWNDTTKLSWDDFTGEPAANTNLGSALTVLTPAKFKEPTFFDTATVTVECFMVKNASWVVKSKAKKQLLAYNQTLFDIHELSVRKLRKIFTGTNFKVKDPTGLFNDIYGEHNKELAKTISQYRSETEDGVKTKILMDWVEKTARELSVLDDFKGK